MRKRILCMTLISAMILSGLTACGSKDTGNTGADTTETETASAEDAAESVDTSATDVSEDEIEIPDGFHLVTDRAKSNYVVNDCEPYVKGLEDKQNFDAMILICYHTIDIGNMEQLGIHTTVFPWLDPYSLLEKYNIHDTVDMIKFYEEHYDFKQNLFTKSDDIKINYIARTYTTMTLSSYDKFYYLDQDLRGYSFEYKRGGTSYFQQTELVYNTALYGETKYGISFHNNKEEYFNHDNSFEIVSSISKR